MSGEKATERTYWCAPDLGIENKPLIVSLLQYRQHKNRHLTMQQDANLISSKTTDGRQMPIIDLDFNFHIVPSSTPGHVHLFIDHPMSKFRWAALMLALWFSGSVEMGYAVWSLRRGGNFVRMPEIEKQPGAETDKPEYGWFFKIKDQT